MKLTKNIRQYIKIALSAGLLAFPSCSYLDVIPPAQPDFDDTMKRSSAATLGSPFTRLLRCFAIYLHGEKAMEMLRWPPMNMSSRKTGTGICRKCWHGTVSAARSDIGDWENLYNYIGYVHYFLEQLDRLNPAGVTEEEKGTIPCRPLVSQPAYYHFKVLQNYGPCPIIETKGRSKHPSVRNSGALCILIIV
ncbi:MAG: hypothetical protein ACLR6J_11670 [Parabacteroides merdae]